MPNKQNPKYSALQRKLAQELLEKGFTYSEVSGEVNVPEPTLRRWVSDYKWITPYNVVKRTTEKVQALLAPCDKGKKLPLTPAEIQERVEQMWAERALSHRTVAFEKSHKALTKANLPPPKTWKDAEVADRMARRASGLDDSPNGKNRGESEQNVPLVSIGILTAAPAKREVPADGVTVDVSQHDPKQNE